MSDPYTSFETSLRLKQAGAPQDDENFPVSTWVKKGESWLPLGGTSRTLMDSIRRFRADEILAAISPNIQIIDFLPGYFEVTFETYWSEGQNYGVIGRYTKGSDSLVEALAAAWLAMLEEPRSTRGCPDFERCHGSMKWCDFCGDVGKTCDDCNCDQHHELWEAPR